MSLIILDIGLSTILWSFEKLGVALGEGCKNECPWKSWNSWIVNYQSGKLTFWLYGVIVEYYPCLLSHLGVLLYPVFLCPIVTLIFLLTHAQPLKQALLTTMPTWLRWVCQWPACLWNPSILTTGRGRGTRQSDSRTLATRVGLAQSYRWADVLLHSSYTGMTGF